MSVAERIFLIGYRGTGKSTIGQRLAMTLGWDFVDADVEIEQRCQTSIRELFASEGEAGFRDREAALLAELANREPCVIATGGGCVLRPENRDRLRTGFVVWLTAAPAMVLQRIQGDPTTAERRPNLTAAGGLFEIEELMNQRQPLYRSCADFVIATDLLSPDQLAMAILQAWSSSSTTLI